MTGKKRKNRRFQRAGSLCGLALSVLVAMGGGWWLTMGGQATSAGIEQHEPPAVQPPQEDVSGSIEHLIEGDAGNEAAQPPKDAAGAQQEQTEDAPDTKETLAAADSDWFSDALFIGDSRTEGLMLYAPPEGATFFAEKGLTVTTALTKEVARVNGKKTTIENALKQVKFGKIYLSLGVNELGWVYPSVYAEKYAVLVQSIQALQPDAEIFVQSLLPVSAEKSNSDGVYNNKRISSYNELLKKMAEEQQATYLDVGPAVADETGALPAGATTDGVHLNKEYCKKWADFLSAHTGEE